MKLVYLLLMLLPGVASACTAEFNDFIPAGILFVAAGVILTFLAGAVILVVMRLLPSNRGLTMRAIFAKAKKYILISIGVVCTVLLIGLAGTVGMIVHESSVPRIDANGNPWYPLC